MKCKIPVCIITAGRYWLSKAPAGHEQSAVWFFGAQIKLSVPCKNMHEREDVAELQIWPRLIVSTQKDFIKLAVCLKRYILALFVRNTRKIVIHVVNINPFHKINFFPFLLSALVVYSLVSNKALKTYAECKH